MTAPTPEQRRRSGTRALLDSIARGDPDELLRLRDLIHGFGDRAFGVLLFLAIPTAFLPGAATFISTPIVLLVGVQLLLMRRAPWLPRWLGERGPHRDVIQRFERRFDPWLRRIERVVKPRWLALVDHRAADMFTGLLLVLVGILLALPIPFTNAAFAALLLLFALALLERDGLLMLVAWAIAAVLVLVTGVLSGELAAAAAHWIDRLS